MKEIGADIAVLDDMKYKGSIGNFISGLILQVLLGSRKTNVIEFVNGNGKVLIQPF